MTMTYSEALAAHQITIPAHLIAQAEVPVLTGPQTQGDLIVIPTRPGINTGSEVPAEGVQVVRGEATTNTHWLDAYNGPVMWAPTTGGSRQDLGVLTVPDGSVAMLTHTEEHGANGIGAGTYIIRRQREQADEIRIVQD